MHKPDILTIIENEHIELRKSGSKYDLPPLAWSTCKILHWIERKEERDGQEDIHTRTNHRETSRS